MNVTLRNALTIQPQEAPQTPALADLIPARARALGCTDFEDYCDLIDREANADLSGAALVRASRFRTMRRPRAYFDRRTDTYCLSISINNSRTMFAKVDAVDWVAMQEAGQNGHWLAAQADDGGISVVTRLMPNPADAGSVCDVADIIMAGELLPNHRPGFLDGDGLNMCRSNMVAMAATKPISRLRRAR